jgi:hypothetical protein
MKSNADQNLAVMLLSNTKFNTTASHSQHSNSHHITSFTSQLYVLAVAYLNQKDERALIGNLQSRKFF